jgi:hypothetical protein
MDEFVDTVTLYNLVVTDAASGQSDVVTERSPLVGRRQAEGEMRHMERINHNPTLRYSVEPSRRKA